jgi:hypothetical protein
VNLAKARRPVAVVDERTYRQAVEAVTLLLDTGEYRDLMRAEHVAVAVILWLRYEIHTGRRSKRASRAARLEHWEMHLDQIRAALTEEVA